MSTLKIAPGLSLPPDVVTQTFAILALRRVGKTYTASVMAEEMIKAKLPFVALDPTGAWWGLRASADGQRAGYPVIIIGGAHADVPLEPSSGKVIADLVVDHPGWYVIDMSETSSNAEQDRIAMEFAEQLYRRKAKHTFALHLFVDEADSFAPQQAFPNQKRMLGAFETLVRRGGIRGIGTTLITQRPAVLNKNVLTQADNLIVLRITSPQDRIAIDDWVKGNGTKEQRDELVASLASLQKGEAWFWSPGTLGVFQRVKIRQRTTFNSSATPEAGEQVIQPKKLAPVDLEKLREKLAATIETAKANDPVLLQKRIAELEKQRGASPDLRKELDALYLKNQELMKRCSADDTKIHRLSSTIAHAMAALQMTGISPAVPTTGSNVVTLGSLSFNIDESEMPKPIVERIDKSKSHERPNTKANPERAAPKEPAYDGTLPEGQRIILTRLIQFPNGLDRNQITALTGYEKKSTRDTYIQRLGIKGLCEVGDNRKVYATAAGKAALSDYRPMPTGKELQEDWCNRLPEGQRRILEELIKVYPNTLDRDEITRLTSYEKKSTRDTYIQRLGQKQLVDTEPGAVKASDTLFLQP